jgi:NTP pyrophosphatase (non-canonical NTP hydrolase)
VSFLSGIWEQQRCYNEVVKAIENRPDTNWAEVYLLGLIGEVNEVLEVTHWKRHKKHSDEPIRENIADELVDLTKYVFCLWQEYGFGLDEFLESLWEKGETLEKEIQHEFYPPDGRNVLVTDLDGTIADFRAGFAEWLRLHNIEAGETQSLSVDLDTGLPYEVYNSIKSDFEASGGYAKLPAYRDGVEMIVNEQELGTYILVVTARPQNDIRRIRADTVKWLKSYGIEPDCIIFGRDERLIQLLKLKGSRRICLLEDEPILALRAANIGTKVMLRSQPYNEYVNHQMIESYNTFPEYITWR